MINHIILILVSLLAGGQRSAVSEGGTRQTCLECHGALLEMKHLHPQLETTCDICHTSTGEEHPGDGKAGFTLAEEVPGLCYACHTDYTGEEGAHAPAKEGYCLICHAVHGSDEKFLLTEKTADLCFGCHTEEGEEFRSSANTHHPVTDEMACNNCHDPHSSVMHPLLKDEANNLCLGCHEKTITRDTVTLTNIGRLLRRSKTVHLPVVQGGCIMCHDPHSSAYLPLLTGYYTSEQYAEARTENFELCFFCHDTDLLEVRETEYATNFRNGLLNLHALHSNGKKGRGCSMCHDPHGTQGERLTVTTIHFVRWTMKMDFRLTDNGATCATGCHGIREYDRVNPVDYSK